MKSGGKSQFDRRKLKKKFEKTKKKQPTDNQNIQQWT